MAGRSRRRVAAALALCLLALPQVSGARAAGRDGSVTRVSTEGGLGRIEIHGKIGAVLQRDEGTVALLDMKDPARPKVLGRYDTAKDSLDGDLAFSADGKWLFYARQTRNFDEEGVHVLDVSDPKQPSLAYYLPAGGSYRVQYLKQGDAEWVVLLDAIDGLVVSRFVPTTGALIPVHVDPLPALKVGGPASAGMFYDPKDPALGVPLLYVTTGRTGLQVFDYSNPADPALLGSWRDVGLAEVEVDATKKKRTVYAATEYWFAKSLKPEILVLDATKLDGIEQRRKFGLGLDAAEANYVQGMALRGARLYAAHSSKGLVVFDARSGRRVDSYVVKGQRNPNAGVQSSPYAIDVELRGSVAYFTDAATGTISSQPLPVTETVTFDVCGRGARRC